MIVVQSDREQIETLATEAPARAPAPGTSKRETGQAAGSRRAKGHESGAGGRPGKGVFAPSLVPSLTPRVDVVQIISISFIGGLSSRILVFS